MKKNWIFFLFVGILVLFALGCGGGNGSGTQTSDGTLKINLTDAKPALPSGVEKVWVTIDGVSVHRAGAGWISLPLAQSPYTVDLLQFSNGRTTELVPPVQLASGRYTQIRLSVSGATLQINGLEEPLSLGVPSGTLKTDKEFSFEVTGGGAVDLTVDFDLSRSIVAKGSGGYQLKPVLHLVRTEEAATIQGRISNSTFGSEGEATVIVYSQENNGTLEEYTTLRVEKDDGAALTFFQIFWLVCEKTYVVRVEIGPSQVYEEKVDSGKLTPGVIFPLNSNQAI